MCHCVSIINVLVRGGRGGGGGFFFFGGSGGEGSSIAVIIFVILVICLVIYLIYLCQKSTDKDSPNYPGASSEGYTKCYLCLGKIRQSRWEDGSHRKSCIQENRRMVETMPQPYPVNCPNCFQLLRQWPERGPEVSLISL